MVTLKNSSKFKNDLIIGCLLGDASIRKDGVLFVGHGASQREYVEWKFKLLSKQFSLKRFEREIHFNGKSFIQVGFYSSVTNYTKLVRRIAYQPIKTINRKQLNKLSPIGLAIWYMDDGCLSFIKKDRKIDSRQIILNTQGFSYDEQVIMQVYFKEAWGIETRIHRDKDKFRLWMNGTNANKFINLIGDNIPSCMNYKKCFRFGKRKSELNLCNKECSSNCPFGITK